MLITFSGCFEALGAMLSWEWGNAFVQVEQCFDRAIALPYFCKSTCFNQ
jgi:hypothetical protein